MNSLIVFGAQYLILVVLLGALVPLPSMNWSQRRSYCVTGLVGGTIALVLLKIVSGLYFDPRPFTHGVPSLISHVADNGFPSDHATLGLFAATLVVLVRPRLGAGLVAIALLVGVSRVLAGVHSPIDIVGGVVIGMVSAYFASLLVKRLPMRH